MTTRRKHSAQHTATSLDPLIAQTLGSDGAILNALMRANGVGGWTIAPTPTTNIALHTSSGVGTWNVPSSVAIGDLVYHTGVAASADRADNASILTTPALGVVIAKPSAITATVAYPGEISGFSALTIDMMLGLTPGVLYFLGTLGVITAAAPSTIGSVVQRIGVAKDSNTLVFEPSLQTVLL